MLKSSAKYLKFIAFPVSDEKKEVPGLLFWCAIALSFLIVNLPIDKISIFIEQIASYLQQTLPNLPEIPQYKYDPDFYRSNLESIILNQLVVPIKGFLFFLSFLIIIYPVVVAIVRAKPFWQRIGIRRIALSSLVIFVILSILVFPYAYPVGPTGFHHPFGNSGMGIGYANLSLQPFAADTNWYYRRLLKPFIAYLFQLKGTFLYYVFSLVCTYLLIFLIVAFVESKVPSYIANKETDRGLSIVPLPRLFIYASLGTCSYVITDFLWPGLVDQVTFSLILLMASMPMNRQARMSVIALCMLNHELSSLAIFPLILFCFPKRDIKASLLVLALYFVNWVGTYGLSVNKALAVHQSIYAINELSSHPLTFFTGVFIAHKFFWLILFFVFIKLKDEKDLKTPLAIFCITLLPLLPAIVFHTDTARSVGYSFFGILISLTIFLEEFCFLSRPVQQVLLGGIYASLVIPSYPVIINLKSTVISYPYRGLYQIIHTSIQPIVRSLFS